MRMALAAMILVAGGLFGPAAAQDRQKPAPSGQRVNPNDPAINRPPPRPPERPSVAPPAGPAAPMQRIPPVAPPAQPPTR
jgi:hypothetical protein